MLSHILHSSAKEAWRLQGLLAGQLVPAAAAATTNAAGCGQSSLQPAAPPASAKQRRAFRGSTLLDMSSRICSSSAGLQASPSNPCHTFGVRGLVTSTAAASASDGGGTARQLQALSERLDAAEQKLVVLEAKEGIRQAVHQFAQFLDAARQKPQDVITRDSIGALFTASASIDLKQYGSVEDLDSIQPFLQRYASKLVYSKNHVANLTVDVSKEKPTSGLARFYLLSAGTLAQGRESVWALETLLVKMQKGFDEKWRIRSLEYEPGALLTPYAGPGWDTAPNILQELLEREQKQ